MAQELRDDSCQTDWFHAWLSCVHFFLDILEGSRNKRNVNRVRVQPTVRLPTCCQHLMWLTILIPIPFRLFTASSAKRTFPIFCLLDLYRFLLIIYGLLLSIITPTNILLKSSAHTKIFFIETLDCCLLLYLRIMDHKKMNRTKIFLKSFPHIKFHP